MDSNFESWSQKCIFEIIFLSWFQICNSETTIQYLTPSDNENKMREDLPKFEDSMFFLDELMPHSEVQNFKTRKFFIIFRYFSWRHFSLFKWRVWFIKWQWNWFWWLYSRKIEIGNWFWDKKRIFNLEFY